MIEVRAGIAVDAVVELLSLRLLVVLGDQGLVDPLRAPGGCTSGGSAGITRLNLRVDSLEHRPAQ